MRLLLIWVVLSILPSWGVANDWDALESPNAVLLMRHALAPGTGDPPNFEIGDCSTQRNLDTRGREQAARIGAALRERNVDVDAVWTSQWCRCRDTADLLDLAEVTEVPSLNSFYSRRAREEAQTDATLALLAEHDDKRLVLVTHQVNITALTGLFPRSGEIFVAERTREGLTVTGRILIDP